MGQAGHALPWASIPLCRPQRPAGQAGRIVWPRGQEGAVGGAGLHPCPVSCTSMPPTPRVASAQGQWVEVPVQPGGSGGASLTWGPPAAGGPGRPGGRRGGSRHSRGAPRRPGTPHTRPRSSAAGRGPSRGGGDGTPPPGAPGWLRHRGPRAPRSPGLPPCRPMPAPRTPKAHTPRRSTRRSGRSRACTPTSTLPLPGRQQGAGPSARAHAVPSAQGHHPACALACMAPTMPSGTPPPPGAPGVPGWAPCTA